MDFHERCEGCFQSRAKQSTNLASILATNLKVLPILLPTENEQPAILQHIDAKTTKFDTLYTTTERALALLKERRFAIIAAALTGQLEIT